MLEMTRLSGQAATAQDVIAALERDGGVIVEDFLASETLDGLRNDLLPLIERQAVGRDSFSGNCTRRLSRLFSRTRHCAALATHPLYLPVAEHFLGKPREVWVGDRRVTLTAGVRIGVTQAIQIGPGQAAQPLHRDDTAFMWRHPTAGREGRVQIICAVSDFTAENGGTLVIPGSHLWDDDRKPELSEAQPTIMKAGSALIFLGSTFHAGGANTTQGEYRTAVGIALDAANVRQEENMYLSMTPEDVASYPEQIQRLLGWSAGDNHMGWVEVDGQMIDPIHLLGDLDSAAVRGVGARRD
ncbi:phytanoyl-CoA dioxygenase family protein [Ralstonia soli]|uniref:Phytanoyl-CoA dioxygenase family protein n=1 Tax=Ralstonia soli TaxID=2953896 RepID=A0ABT1AGR2_9RALS|nr:phytanoyl-CoA dioxygenase family protein [Ralstonia soli]MCO5397509.1 phytanoyl-CoA dioxygenase family protein [Ralstonia soli]